MLQWFIVLLSRRKWISYEPSVPLKYWVVMVAFYSNVFLVSKDNGVLWSILNLRKFSHSLCISTFKVPTIRQVWQLIEQSDYAFLLISRTYIWILLFLNIIGPRAFTSIMKPILFLCQCKCFCFIISLDDILVLIHSKHVGKRAWLFFCSLLVWFGLCINFPGLNFTLVSGFVSWDCFGIGCMCLYLCHLINSLRYSNWLIPCCRHGLLWSMLSCLF